MWALKISERIVEISEVVRDLNDKRLGMSKEKPKKADYNFLGQRQHLRIQFIVKPNHNSVESILILRQSLG